MFKKTYLIFLLFICIFPLSCFATNHGKTSVNTVGKVCIVPMDNVAELGIPTGVPQGLILDLFHLAMKNLGWEYSKEKCSINDVFQKVHDTANNINIGVGGLTITGSREQLVDFSTVMYESRFAMMVKGRELSDWVIISRSFASPVVVLLAAIYFGYFILIGVLFVFMKNPAGFEGMSNWKIFWKGVWGGFKASEGIEFDFFMTRTPLRKFLTGFIRIFGYMVIGTVLISKMSSMLVLAGMDQHMYQDPRDLRGVKVATKLHTTSYAYLKKIGADVIGTTSIDESYELLQNEEVEVVVYDEAPMENYIRKGNDVRIIGRKFQTQFYGIAISHEYPSVREALNREILNIMEGDEFVVICNKYRAEGTCI